MKYRNAFKNNLISNNKKHKFEQDEKKDYI